MCVPQRGRRLSIISILIIGILNTEKRILILNLRILNPRILSRSMQNTETRTLNTRSENLILNTKTKSATLPLH